MVRGRWWGGTVDAAAAEVIFAIAAVTVNDSSDFTTPGRQNRCLFIQMLRIYYLYDLV